MCKNIEEMIIDKSKEEIFYTVGYFKISTYDHIEYDREETNYDYVIYKSLLTGQEIRVCKESNELFVKDKAVVFAPYLTYDQMVDEFLSDGLKILEKYSRL